MKEWLEINKMKFRTKATFREKTSDLKKEKNCLGKQYCRKEYGSIVNHSKVSQSDAPLKSNLVPGNINRSVMCSAVGETQLLCIIW